MADAKVAERSSGNGGRVDRVFDLRHFVVWAPGQYLGEYFLRRGLVVDVVCIPMWGRNMHHHTIFKLFRVESAIKPER